MIEQQDINRGPLTSSPILAPEEMDLLIWTLRQSCALNRVLATHCGSGQFVRRLLAHGIDAFGTDTDPDAVAGACRFIPGRCERADASTLPFDDHSFDTLICLDGLSAAPVEEVDRFIREGRRVARRHALIRVTPAAAAQRPREWWDTRFLHAGWRRHPATLRIIDYNTLDAEPTNLILLYERIPDAALALYPLRSLAAERGLHMDMLREAGRRSDAHVQRYVHASTLVRPNDVVLDVACGLGYGLAILAGTGRASRLIGIDASAYAIAYARTMYGDAASNLELHEGDAHDLSAIPAHSVDLVVSFETLEHLERPHHFLREVARVLKPGGRFIGSVPNEWLDETGRDPNPHHLHVFDAERLLASFDAPWLIESLIAQTAGGGMKATGPKGRTWQSTAVRPDTTEIAEWWIVVAMKDSLAGRDVPYQETVYATAPGQYRPASVSFDEAYENPWVRHALVSRGVRLRDAGLRQTVAERLVAESARGSVAQGAALCVLAYGLLEGAATDEAVRHHLERIAQWLSAAGDSRHHLRWSVSLEHVAGRLALGIGDRRTALAWLERCATRDASRFSPLLASRTIDAAWLAGQMHASEGRDTAARRWWRHGVDQARLASAADWREVIGSPDAPLTFGLREMSLVFDAATRCAASLEGQPSLAAAPGRTPEILLSNCGADMAEFRRLTLEDEVRRLRGTHNALIACEGQLRDAHERLAHLRDALSTHPPLLVAGTQTRVGIFGTGSGAMRVWEALAGLDGAGAIWFADNNPSKQGQHLLGLDIIAPAEMFARGFDVVAIGSMSRTELSAQLLGLGVKAEQIITPSLDTPPAQLREELAAALASRPQPASA